MDGLWWPRAARIGQYWNNRLWPQLGLSAGHRRVRWCESLRGSPPSEARWGALSVTGTDPAGHGRPAERRRGGGLVATLAHAGTGQGAGVHPGTHTYINVVMSAGVYIPTKPSLLLIQGLIPKNRPRLLRTGRNLAAKRVVLVMKQPKTAPWARGGLAVAHDEGFSVGRTVLARAPGPQPTRTAAHGHMPTTITPAPARARPRHRAPSPRRRRVSTGDLRLW